MATVIRAEISKKSPYWISKHRYYELKHFCLQYPEWRQAYVSLDGLSKGANDALGAPKNRQVGDPTSNCAEKRMRYAEKMRVIEQAAMATDSELANYILKGVTEERSYTNLKMMFGIPCCKEVYYELYRKFFWILDKQREQLSRRTQRLL